MASIEFRVKPIKSPEGVTAILAEVDGSIDSSTIQQFQEVMDKLVARGTKNLVLDCASVKYINSTGLGTLLKYSDTFESISGHIAFCRVPSKVLLVMEMLGFNALFTIVPDEAAALRSFAGKAAPAAAGDVPAAPAAPVAAPAATPAAPAAAPAAPPAIAFPLQCACARCRVTLDVPAPGRYKCPRCGVVLSMEPTGHPRFFALKKTRPVAVTVPCKPEVAASVAELAGKCAAGLGFNGNSVDGIAQAIASACTNVIERAYDRDVNSVFHMLISASGNALTVRISDYGKPFDFGPNGSIHSDSGFAAVVKAMDTVEHRPNPSGGNLLTLIKILQK
ncbi:MAG: STAS domain-containing protein [Planctomycetota bacterium]